ncbi:alpha-amylase [Plakobranchus ocellatus]|uniref:Alpha-amylase n=1 Tax=Plakobranchus ocellatus TaxID=259542 RepID=A0AAV4BJ31_9GAST|nr:alpha-amylase [Plakobranchus ocellatus]
MMFRLSIAFAVLLAMAMADPVEKRQEEEDDQDQDQGDFQETIIFLKRVTVDTEELFLRGGVGNRQDCQPDEAPEDDPCAIPISHIDLEMTSKIPNRNAYANGDLFLTWGGNEPGQTSNAAGTPAQWTTNDRRKPYYNALNVYGEHMWMVRVNMDCSVLQDGFFDFKGILNNQWEGTIASSNCNGNGAQTPPYTSENHIGRCGYINVFEWDSPSCTIESF